MRHRELDSDEIVARFIYSKNHFSRAGNRPKPGAFSPYPHSELSVAHVTDLTDAEVWEISLKTVGSEPGRDKVHARADVRVRELIRNKLRAIRDDDPFERHTSVTGWPGPNDPNERKEQLKLICLELSQSPDVNLVVPAGPIARAFSS